LVVDPLLTTAQLQGRQLPDIGHNDRAPLSREAERA